MNVQLTFEGIRCFTEKQSASIRPLTVLIGENSSGKSTFLALYQAACALAEGLPVEPTFNEPPFHLGAYEHVASYRGGRAGRAKSFRLGIEWTNGPESRFSLSGEFVQFNAQPAVNHWLFSGAGFRCEMSFHRAKDVAEVKISAPEGEDRFSVPLYQALWVPGSMVRLAYRYASQARPGKILKVKDESYREIDSQILKMSRYLTRHPIALAPVRTSPERTYDPVSQDPRPEGSHIPMLLARLAQAEPDRWRHLSFALSEFGMGSGMFEKIEVVRKGKKESDPFQLGVKSGGPTVNLVDVGYGVSQVLPILVDSIQRSNRPATFLLQQPEVHLHPRAQAQLGSFFVANASENTRFVVETHSDYLIDRIRMEIRNGKSLSSKDVSFLYFDRGKAGVRVYNLNLDADGQITNAPMCYRKFFMEEERRLLGI